MAKRSPPVRKIADISSFLPLLYLDACRSRVNVSVSDVSAMPIESLCQATDAAATNTMIELHTDRTPSNIDAAIGEVGIPPDTPVPEAQLLLLLLFSCVCITTVVVLSILLK